MKLQKQIAKNRVVLALPIALLMAANAWGNTGLTFPTENAKVNVNYIDEFGKKGLYNDCYIVSPAQITGDELDFTGLGCVVFNTEFTYNGKIYSKNTGDIVIIIGNGAKVTINYTSSSTNNHAIHAANNLKIYSQPEQAGSLTVNVTGTNGRALSAGNNIYIYGGRITATSQAKDAIWAQNNIKFYRGYISATTRASSYTGIKSETANIYLSWVNSIYATGYFAKEGNVLNNDNVDFKDESNTSYSTTVLDSNAIKGKTLTPVDYLVHFVTNGNGSKRALINGDYKGTASVVTDIAEQSNVVAIDYNRTFTAGVPATVVLPFSLPEGATTNAKFYRLKQVVQVDGACAWNASAQNIATDPAENAIKRPQANEPYIVMLNEGNKLEFDLSSSSVTFNQSENPTTTVSNENWSFIGVYSFKEWKDPNDKELGLAYAFAGSNENNTKQGKFGKIAIAKDAATTGYPYANPFRAYLKKRDSDVRLQCPQAGQNSAQYILGHNTETIDVQFIDEDENGEKTTFMARMNTRTGEFTMLPNYDAKGRKIAAPKVRGAYYGKKVLKNKDVK